MSASINSNEVYSIDYTKPGVVIIFNNQFFSEYDTIAGSEKDVQSLFDVFDDLKYEVPPAYINQTEARMRNAIDEYAQRDYTSYGSLLIFIMSHVNKGKIISSDSLYIDLNEFISPLKMNKSLKGKPKKLLSF